MYPFVHMYVWHGHAEPRCVHNYDIVAHRVATNETSQDHAVKGKFSRGFSYPQLIIITTVKPVLSDHAWAKKKWSLNRGGLLIEVKMHCKATIGT